ncbi:MAG: LPS-assembly protein LptD [Flavobacteriales bacterium]|nr:LPS-assembly protein LptD [Flavobacteriales bacterium]
MVSQKSSHIFTKIVFKPLRTNLFYIVLSAIFLTIGCGKISAQESPNNSKPIPAKNQPDNLKKDENGPIVSTTIIDTIKVDSLKKGKGYLEGKVKYKAKDYAKFDHKNKLLTLSDGAELKYLDYELKAGKIVYDYKKNEVYAGRLKDSTGKYYQYPVFIQGSTVIEPDSIRFNTVTKKAKVWNTKTNQGEFWVHAALTKKENDSVYFMKGARFTTSKDLDDPEYYFLTNKVKFVPKKKIVVGFTNMWIYNVPTPLALPFAFFPMTEEARSGILIPNYTYTEQRGYALQNGGYYFALSDNYDLAVLGDYYTNGSYALRFESQYAKRYKFNGNFNLRYENLIDGERGFPNYSKGTIYNIQWSHSKDAKSNPNSRFTASVNLGSSKYFRQSLNQVNVGSNLNNSLNSSISYSRTFNTLPQVNFALAATHSQNTNTEKISMTLPTLTLNVDRVFPFASETKPKKGFFQNINVRYDLTGSNSYNTSDSLFFKSQMFKEGTTGFQHNIPLSTNFKIFKHFNVNTAINYKEVWYLQTINRRTDFETNKVVDDRVNGFDSFRTYSFSNGLSTTLYGMYTFGEDKKVKVIRHTITPSVSHGYTPKFDQYLEQYEASRTYGRFTGPNTQSEYRNYTRFDTGIYGAPNLIDANSVGFSLGNLFEAKVTDRDSTKTEPKKIQLLRLNLGSSYDFKTKQWSTISFNGGTAFFDQKMAVNFGGSIDPYEFENTNSRFVRKAFGLSGANLSMNYALASSSFGKKKEKKNTQGQRNGGREDDLFGVNEDFSDKINTQPGEESEEETETPAELFKSDIPWDVTMAFTITYSNNDFGNKISSSSLMLSVNSQVTPKWKMGVSTGYDFVNKGVSQTQIRMDRDLLSWTMNFNWVPFGTYTYWGFFIGIKSSVLSDIKWDKRSVPDRTLR